MNDTKPPLHSLAARALLDLVDDVCARRGVTRNELLGRTRTHAIVAARQEFWWLIRHHPGRCYSYAEIAAIVGRDPSTVLHGIVAHQRRHRSACNGFTRVEQERRGALPPSSSRPLPDDSFNPG